MKPNLTLGQGLGGEVAILFFLGHFLWCFLFLFLFAFPLCVCVKEEELVKSHSVFNVDRQ